MSKTEDRRSSEITNEQHSSTGINNKGVTKKDECGQKDCPEARKCLTSEKILCHTRNAVVKVHSEFILFGAEGPAPDATPLDISLQPLAPNARADIILEGNGFFIEDHYIVTPAHLVLMPPSLTSVVNRYPSFKPQTLGEESTRMQDIMMRASRILVSIFNVNNKKHSFVYEAELVGVDGAGDIAVLRINPRRHFNLCNPCIEKCHPYLKFGCSRKTSEGEKVYLVGDDAITEGLLSNNNHLDHTGWVLAETILVSAPGYTFSSGLPILDCQGHVIGMQTTNLIGSLKGPGSISGPSEFFMRRIVKALIKGSSSRKCNIQLETICDPAGTYFRYRKAYLGLAYEVFTGADYDVTVDYDSGAIPEGAPRIRLDANGDFLNSPGCKELMGIRVVGLAGLNPSNESEVVNGLYYVPGGEAEAPLMTDLPVSGLSTKIQPGDVITHINDMPIGDLLKQVAPSLITWRLVEGEQVNICYRRGGNFANDGTNDFAGNYDNIYQHSFCTADYPMGLDYPWYAVGIFPLLANNPYPGFTFGNQITNPKVPQLATTNNTFRPSI